MSRHLKGLAALTLGVLMLAVLAAVVIVFVVAVVSSIVFLVSLPLIVGALSLGYNGAREVKFWSD